MKAENDIATDLVVLIDRLPLPAGPGRLVGRRAPRHAPALYLAAAALALVFAVGQIAPLRDAAGTLLDEATKRSGRITARPDAQTGGARLAADLVFRARQVVDRTRYLKVERRQTGTYWVPGQLGQGETCPPKCYDRPGFYDEEWTRTWEYDFTAGRARVVIDRPARGRYLEERYIGARSFLRDQPDGPWYVRDDYVEGYYDSTAGSGMSSRIVLGYSGPWPTVDFRAGFDSQVVFQDFYQSLSGRASYFAMINDQLQLGPDVACDAGQCATVSLTLSEDAGGLQGTATWTILIDKRNDRPVETRSQVVWADGRSWHAVTRIFYDAPITIEPPKLP